MAGAQIWLYYGQVEVTIIYLHIETTVLQDPLVSRIIDSLRILLGSSLSMFASMRGNAFHCFPSAARITTDINYLKK